MYDLQITMEMNMGGVGSGRQRSTHNGDVEDVLALDIRALRRLGLIRPGECVIDTICWSIGGPSALRARLRIDLSDIERSCTLRIATKHPNGTIRSMPCHRRLEAFGAISYAPAQARGAKYSTCAATSLLHEPPTD